MLYAILVVLGCIFFSACNLPVKLALTIANILIPDPLPGADELAMAVATGFSWLSRGRTAYRVAKKVGGKISK